jgi:serine/threonine protein kinase
VTAEGELIAGRYRLLSRVGRGAMGIVWQGRDERLDRVVAIKQLLVDADEQAGRAAVREGRVAARLRHPHAIMVHDVVEHDARPFLIMEYFPSQSLASVLTQRGVLDPDAVARLGSQLASALAAAHADGIVHRDVTPGNVLISTDGTAKIADFGIARALGDGTLTGSDIIMGTPAYLAPEVADGQQVAFSSDVFSLGATLYTALEGGPPFGRDDNPIALLRRVAHGVIIPPRRTGPLTDVVLWLMRPNPGDRPTMAMARDLLTTLADGGEVELPPPAPRLLNPTLTLPAARRKPRRAMWLGAIGALLLAAGVLLGSLITNHPSAVVATGPPATQPTSTPASPQPRSTVCEARYQVTGSWPGGYQVSVTVLGKERPALTGWEVHWVLPAGHSISQLWNGTLRQDGSSVTVTNASWNAVVAADNSTTFGLNASIPAGSLDPGTDRPVLTCRSP